MADICGYAINILSTTVEHTYVKSSDGYTWHCFGHSDGGKEICVGSGDSKVCNELAGPNSQAEIKYGITGVCHQAANRILLPTGETVKKAGGYSVSVWAYGVYRKHVQDFCKNHKIESCPNNTLNLYQEFELLLRNKLDNNVNNNLSGKLNEIHKNFHIRKAELINDLSKQKFSPRDYANQFNKELSNTLNNFARELTTTEFKRIFDLVPDEHIILVDPEIMVLEHKFD